MRAECGMNVVPSRRSAGRIGAKSKRMSRDSRSVPMGGMYGSLSRVRTRACAEQR